VFHSTCPYAIYFSLINDTAFYSSEVVYLIDENTAARAEFQLEFIFPMQERRHIATLAEYVLFNVSNRHRRMAH
jgi:hypothetical protein